MNFKPQNNAYILKPGTVHVWFADIIASDNDYHTYNELLSKDERNRAESFKFEKDKIKYVIRKGILRRLSSSYLGVAPNDVVFEYGEFGKPKFAFSNELQFNISHSGNKAVFAFTHETHIGADIELIKNDLDVLNLAENFFSAREINDLKNLDPSEQHTAFYRCWTRKEAFIKAKGIGLSFPLKSFSVSVNTDKDAELMTTEWDSSERLSWKLFSHQLSEKYISAIALQDQVDSIVYREWNNPNDVTLESSIPKSEVIVGPRI